MMQAVMTPTNRRDHARSDAAGADVPATQLDTSSTVSLLPLATRGDRRALEILIERMRPYLKRTGHGKLPSWARSRAETEDLVQESLIRALRHLPRFEGQTIRDFRNWLHTVFKNSRVSGSQTSWARTPGRRWVTRGATAPRPT